MSDSTTSRLRILQTTDLHMAVLPYDYAAGCQAPGTGLLGLAPTINRLRSAGITTCLFDTGDFLQGNALAIEVVAQRTTPHPMIDAMNTLRYDAVGLGNHEFDFGLPALQSALADLRCPALLANVMGGDGTPAFRPTALIQKMLTDTQGATRPIAIGLVAVVTPNVVFTGRDDAQLAVMDMKQAVVKHSQALKAAGADIVVVLAHCGIGGPDQATHAMTTAQPLAETPDVDVLLTGHVHRTFPNPARPPQAHVDPIAGTVHGKPVVMAGAFGSHLGQIDLDLTWHDGRWVISNHNATLLAATDLQDPPDAATASIRDTISPLHEQTLDRIRAPVAKTRDHIHSYFSQIMPDASQQLLAEAKQTAVRTALAGGDYGGLPVLASAAPYRAGGDGGISHYVDLPPGTITLRDVMMIYPFPNALAAVLQTGRDLRHWLARAARHFLQIAPGAQDQPIIDPAFATYNFDTIFGLTYMIDLSQPAGPERITDLRHQGRPVADDDRFVVATNAFRMGGGGGYAAIPPDKRIFLSKKSSFDHFLDSLRGTGTLATKHPPVWSFATMPDTTALFQSSPRAAQHIPALTDRNVAHAGPRADGFSDYRITL